jgi:ribonucleotide reductase beta subunit family protein with ferritin-like domain
MGYKKIYNVKANPLSGWLNSFYDSKKIQVAPQETEISSYVKGVDNKMDESVFDIKL